MPIERTLTDPLSTQEIKEIAIQEFKRRMDANSLLADGLTYSGFSLKFEGMFSLPGRETLIWAEVQKGEKPAADDEKVSGDFEYRSQNPNEARQSHDLPIPVEVKTPSGTERRKVKFAAK
jgi:hypothetical protein